jgi:hypothetical protein
MRGIRILLVFLFLLCCSSTVRGEVNPFQQRKIVIRGFENRGEAKYDYLGEALANSLYEYALSISFIALTDDERAELKRLSLLEEYAERFKEAGQTVGYRLSPVVVREDKTNALDISIYGFYDVAPDERVTLTTSAYNGLTGEEYVRHQTEEELSALIRNPDPYLAEFFKRFLRYKTYTLLISTEPRDALVFIDDMLINVGKSHVVLVTPGSHRITVKKDGYRSFSDIIHVREDFSLKQIVLEKEKTRPPVEYAVTPAGTRIYTGERYAGASPTSVGLRALDRTVTFVKDGYSHRTVSVEEIEGKEKYESSLISFEMKEKLLNDAERHKKGSETLYYTGIGMVGVSILLGIEKTAFQQKADLYHGVDADRYTEALSSANTLTYLTAASAAVTVGLFIFSFIEMLKYFHLYDEPKPGGYDLFNGEVRF